MNSSELSIESCIHLNEINNLNILPSNNFTINVYIDNDYNTLKETNILIPSNNIIINETFCWEFKTTNITITTFKPDHGLQITIIIDSSPLLIEINEEFLNPINTQISNHLFKNVIQNNINFDLYHKISMIIYIQ